MRMTISLDDRLAERVRCAAAERGLSDSAFIAQTLDDAHKPREKTVPPPFKLVTVRGARARPDIDLDRPRSLESLDDVNRFTDGPR